MLLLLTGRKFLAMNKLLQINICSNVLSTGKICEDIAKKSQQHGWDTFIAYGNSHKDSVSVEYKIAGKWNKYLHYLEHKLFDREGFGSRLVTYRMIKWINKVKPDVIHLHNIHDHYLNYPLLFEYLAKIDIPVVWTQHDCWAFTGGCMYYDLQNCDKWKTGCKNCSEHRAFLCDATEKQFALKRKLLSKIKNLTYVSVSDWLGSALKDSHQKDRPIMTIHNGIDISLFKPVVESSNGSNGSEDPSFDKVRKRGKYRIIGVAAVWDKRKGLEDFIKLRSLLPNNYEITLVGLTPKQVKSLPFGVKGITRTTNVQELVHLYSGSDVFVNPTYSDNFPTTNIESLACGTPVITYRTGGSPEAVDSKTGMVIEQGNVTALANAIMQMRENPLSSADCRKRAEELFDKDKCFEKYVELYENLLNEKQK